MNLWNKLNKKMAEWILKSKEFFMKCNRVWTVMRKPTKEEFKVIAQASGLGLLVIGLLGFIISLIFRLTPLGSLF